MTSHYDDPKPFDPSKLAPLSQDTTAFDPSRLAPLTEGFVPPPSLGAVSEDEIDWSQVGTPLNEAKEQEVNFLEVSSRITNDRKSRMQIYRGLLQRPDLPPDQKARIQRFYKKDQEADSWWLNAVDEDRNAANNILRGIADNVVRFGVLGSTDLVAATLQLPFNALKKIDVLNKVPFDAAREAIRNRQEAIKFYFDPQGKAGFAGQVAGTFIGAGPWMAVNRLGLTAASKLPVVGPKLTAFMKTAFAPGAPVKQRLVGELIGSGTVDVVQAMDVVVNDELFPTWDDKYRALALTSAGSLGGAVIGTAARKKLPGPHSGRDATPLSAADAENAKRTVEETLATLKAKAATDAAEIQARRAAKQGAAVIWNGMPEITRKSYIEGLATDDYIKSWKELGPEAKVKVVEVYKTHKEAIEARKAALDAQKAAAAKPAGTNLDKGVTPPDPVEAAAKAIVDKTHPVELTAQAEAAELPTKPIKATKKSKAAPPPPAELIAAANTKLPEKSPAEMTPLEQELNALVGRANKLLTNRTTLGSLIDQTAEEQAIISQIKDVQQQINAKPVDPLEAQLAELKARVAKEGVPPPPADLKSMSLDDLLTAAYKGHAVVDDQVSPIKLDDIIDEVRNRRDALRERLDELNQLHTGGNHTEETDLKIAQNKLDALIELKAKEQSRQAESAKFKADLDKQNEKFAKNLRDSARKEAKKTAQYHFMKEVYKGEDVFAGREDEALKDIGFLGGQHTTINGAKVSVRWEPYLNEITIALIESGTPSQGQGRAALEYLTNLADKYQIPLKLNAKALGEMTQSDLIAWYERNGFHRTGKFIEDADGTAFPEMRRYPKLEKKVSKSKVAETKPAEPPESVPPEEDMAEPISEPPLTKEEVARLNEEAERSNSPELEHLAEVSQKQIEAEELIIDVQDIPGTELRKVQWKNLERPPKFFGESQTVDEAGFGKILEGPSEELQAEAAAYAEAKYGKQISELQKRVDIIGKVREKKQAKATLPTPEAAPLTATEPVTTAAPTPKPAKAPKAKRATTPPTTPAVEVKNYLARVNEPGHITETEVFAELGAKMEADPKLAEEVQALGAKLANEGLDPDGVMEGVEKFARQFLQEEQKIPVPTAAKAKTEKSLFYGIQIKKPLNQFTLDELDKLITKLDKRFEIKNITSDDYGRAMLEIGRAKDIIKGIVKKAPEPVAATPFIKKEEATNLEGVSTVKTKDIVKTQRLPDSYKQPVANMTDEQLIAHASEVKTEIEARTQGIKNPEKQVPELVTRAERVARELKKRGYAMQKEGGFLKTNIGPTLDNRGFLLIPGRRPTRIETPEEKLISSVVKTDAKLGEPFSLRTYITRFLTRVYRKNLALPDPKGPRHMSPREWAEQGNAYQGMAEEFLTGDGPFLPTDDGNYVKTGAPSLQAILNTPGVPPGDAKYLGNLWFALHSIEQAGSRRNVINSNPELLAAAEAMVRNANPASLRAVRALVGYMRSLADFGVWAGLLSPESRSKFDAMFYAPTKVIFASGSKEGQPRTVSLSRKQPDVIAHGQPFKRATGSHQEVVNPIENAIEITHRTLRSAWMNKLTVRLTEWAINNPEQARGLVEPASPQLRNQIKKEVRDGAKALMESTGNAYTLEEADRIVSQMSDRQLSLRDDLMTSWRNGRMEVWRLSPDISFALKSHSPGELALVWRLMGIPGRALHMGIVGNPTFVLTQALLLDPFTAWVRSQYGFVPGVSTAKGLYNAFLNSEPYREYRRAGGGRIGRVSSVASSASRTELADITEPIKYVRNSDGKLVPEHISNLRLVGRQVKEGRLGDAYLTTVSMFEVANRLGEYMRARDAGASQFEAVAAANNVLPNYHRMGASMRSIAYITPFMNIGIQSIGSTVETIKNHPKRWIAKSSTMAIGAAYLWAVNKDDQEIKDLRKTPSGARYFFFRNPWNPEEIMKVRKPYIEAAIFATGMESILDALEENDPEAGKQLAHALLQEASIGFVGPWASIPLQLYYGQEIPSQFPVGIFEPGFLGGDAIPLIPEWQKDIEPMFQYTNASLAARAVGNQLNVSPAKVDALVRGLFGTLGQDAMKGISAAMVYASENHMPVPEEVPFISTFYARYPSNNLQPVRKFYSEAEKVEVVANTINYMALHAPEKLEEYLSEHEEEVAMIELFKDTRKAITDLRKGLGTIKSAPGLSYKEKKDYEREMLRSIIDIARQTNEAVAIIKNEVTE